MKPFPIGFAAKPRVALCCCSKSILVLACASLLNTPALAAPTSNSPYSNVYVLAIGVNNYSDSKIFPNLRFAESDAEEVESVLRLKYAFKSKLLVGPNATKAGILREFDRIAKKMKPNDDFVLFFSGHGATVEHPSDRFGRTGYLIPYGTTLRTNSTANEYDSQAIDARALGTATAAVSGRHRIIIVDACFSGFAASGGTPRRTIFKQKYKMLEPPSVQILTAGAENERAVEMSNVEEMEVRHGLFTYALLEVLHRDASISLFQTFLHARGRVVELAARCNAAASTPQHRLIVQTRGDFMFIPKTRWQQFSEAIKFGDLIATAAKDEGSIPPMMPREYTNVLAELEISKAIAEERISGFEARAASGDVVAMAILTEIYGQGGNAARARMWAREGYDTGSSMGIWSLSRAYRKGYGVQQSDQDADLLAEMSRSVRDRGK